MTEEYSSVDGTAGATSRSAGWRTAALTGASRATAFRELDQLYEAGVLRREGLGRGVRYELNKFSICEAIT